MKKLMIAAAIVCAAAMSHATAIKWSCAGYGMGDSAGYDFMPSGSAIYLLTEATDMDALVKGLTGAAYESTVQTAKVAEGQVGNDGAISIPNGTTTLAAATSAGKDAYFVIFDGDNMFVSNTKALSWVATGDGYYSVDFDATNEDTASWTTPPMDASAGYKGAGWYEAAAVPEPTSGLLLLLGVAGLALRRRRA